MNVFDFAAVIEAKRAALRYTHALQCEEPRRGLLASSPQPGSLNRTGNLYRRSPMPALNDSALVNPDRSLKVVAW